MKEKNIKLLRKGFKILWSTSRIYCLGVLCVSFISGMIGPINAVIYQRLLDEIIEMFHAGKLFRSALVLLIIYSCLTLGGFFLNLISQYIKQTFCDMLDLRITQYILKKSMLFPMETFDNSDIYNHINLGISETSQSCLNILDSMAESVYAIVKGVGYGIIIAQFNIIVVALSIISSVPLLYVSIKTNKYWYNIFLSRIEKLRLINYLKMLLIKNENIKEIKLYRVGDKIINLIKNTFVGFLDNDRVARKRFLFKKMITQSADESITLIIKVMILLFSLQAHDSIGTLVLYFNSQENMKASFSELLNKISVLHNSLLYLESLNVIDSAKVNESETTEGEKFNVSFNVVEFKNVYFKYPGTRDYALKNISLRLERGKTYSIVGFNGSGKTTFIKLLLRLYKPTKGEIYIDGINIQNISLNSYYSNISAIFQDFIKYPFHIWENIVTNENNKVLINQFRYRKAIHLADIEQLIELLPDKDETLLMKDWSGGTDISQGQWQKIAIARCFYSDSVIRILDEPFSSIDANAESRIVREIKEQSKDKLVLYVTHRFSSITMADEIIVMNKGEIQEKGKHQSLMSNKKIYYTLFKSQYNSSY